MLRIFVYLTINTIVMSIQARKLNIIQYLSQTTNVSVLDLIERIIKKEDADLVVYWTKNKNEVIWKIKKNK